MRFLPFICFEAAARVWCQMGVAGAQLSLGLASDEVLRLRRAREE
jgi:hypothetical protein